MSQHMTSRGCAMTWPWTSGGGGPGQGPRESTWGVQSGMLSTHAWQLRTMSLARQAGREGEGAVSVSWRQILSVRLHFRFSLYQFCKLLWCLERLRPMEWEQVGNGRCPSSAGSCALGAALCGWGSNDWLLAGSQPRRADAGFDLPRSLRQLEFHGQVIEDFLNQMQIDVNFQLQLSSEGFAGAWKENPSF